LKLYQADSAIDPFFIRLVFAPSFLSSLHLSLDKETLPCMASALPVQIHNYPDWLVSTLQQLNAYLKGEATSNITSSYQLMPNKAKWQFAWEALREIPYGQTISYKDYSQRIGLKNPRNAGWVLSQNPLPLIFPCHRVIRADGSLGGFTPDPNIKKRLLKLECCAHA
jgi:O-6-methylguanine DNA methyltransferase